LELDAGQRLAVARHLQSCAACRAEEEKVLRLERGLRRTLYALAEREALRPEERTAILSRLKMEIGRWGCASRSFRPAWLWLGAAAAFVFLLFSLVSPLMNAPGGVPVTQATPVARIATHLEARRSTLPTVTLSTTPVQPTAWPAMDLTLSRARETVLPKGTTETGERN